MTNSTASPRHACNIPALSIQMSPLRKDCRAVRLPHCCYNLGQHLLARMRQTWLESETHQVPGNESSLNNFHSRSFPWGNLWFGDRARAKTAGRVQQRGLLLHSTALKVNCLCTFPKTSVLQSSQAAFPHSLCGEHWDGLLSIPNLIPYLLLGCPCSPTQSLGVVGAPSSLLSLSGNCPHLRSCS